MDVAQIVGHLLGLHHGGAPVGKLRFLALLWRKLGQFLDRVAQPVGFARRPLDIGAVARNRGFGDAAGLPQPLDLLGVGIEPAIGIEQAAVRLGSNSPTHS